MIILEPRGDDFKMLSDLIKYIPTDREDLLSYVCYLSYEIGKQTGIDPKEFDITKSDQNYMDKIVLNEPIRFFNNNILKREKEECNGFVTICLDCYSSDVELTEDYDEGFDGEYYFLGTHETCNNCGQME